MKRIVRSTHYYWPHFCSDLLSNKPMEISSSASIQLYQKVTQLVVVGSHGRLKKHASTRQLFLLSCFLFIASCFLVRVAVRVARASRFNVEMIASTVEERRKNPFLLDQNHTPAVSPNHSILSPEQARTMATAGSQVHIGQAGVKDAGFRVSARGGNNSVCSDASVNTHIQWACVARDETLLAVVGDELPDEVLLTARNLLNKKPTLGWDSYHQGWRVGCKGLKFHVYQEGAGEELLVWTFACVYDSARSSKREAQSFLEKIVVISEMWREADDSWKEGRHLACQHFFGPVLQQRMQEFSYLGGMAVTDNELGISSEVVATNRNLINRKNRDKTRDRAEDEALAQANLLRNMDALNKEVLAQDLHEQVTQEEALLRQMEEMNKEVLSATEKANAKEEQATEEEDELDQVWHTGRAYYPPSGAASVFKDRVAPTEHADVTFDESESEDEDGYLEDGAMAAVLRFLDDEFCSTGKSAREESVTSKTSAESPSSNQAEEKVRDFDLAELEQALDVPKSVQAVYPVEDILLGKLDCNEEYEVSPTRVEGIESMLRDLEGDVWGEREARRGAEVRVDSFHEDVSALTEIPVEQKDSNCFLLTFFFPRKSALA
jgi:hypothetical protein